MIQAALRYTLVFCIWSLLLPAATDFHAVNGSCPDDAPALTPAPLEEEWAVDWWMPRHLQKLNEKGRESAEILFLGDSITHGWETAGLNAAENHFSDYKIYNLGFSGDRTENVLWRLKQGEADRIGPKLAVLLIGTNNTGHRKDEPECTAGGVKGIVDELSHRLPSTEILLLAIFPRGELPDDELRMLNEKANQQIKGLGSRENVTFADLNEIYLKDDGRLNLDLMPDGLHPNEQGYEVWASSMLPIIKELMGR